MKRKLLCISTVLALSIIVFAIAPSISPAAATVWTPYSHLFVISYCSGSTPIANISFSAAWEVNAACTQYYLQTVVCAASWYAGTVGSLCLFAVAAFNPSIVGATQIGFQVDWEPSSSGYIGDYANFSLVCIPMQYITLYSGTGKLFMTSGNPFNPNGYPAIDSCYIMWQYEIQLYGSIYQFMVGLDVARNIMYYAEAQAAEGITSWGPYVILSPPNTPSRPSGSTEVYVGSSSAYVTSTTQPTIDSVCYQFSWGDGTTTTTGFYASGTSVNVSHTWSSTGTYNIEVRAEDWYNTGFWSGWSSPLSVSVIAVPRGGGGCPYVYDWNGSAYVKDNNILPASENGNGTDTRDYYLLQQSVVPVFSTKQKSVYSLQIGEFESNVDYINQAELIAVDHQEDTSIAVTQEGQIIAYKSLASPITCVDNNGNNELATIESMNGNVSDPSTYYEGVKGDWLLLDFGRVTGPHANLILRDDMKCAECIDVQVPNANGGWQTIDVLNPRDFWSIEAVNMAAYLPKTGDFIVRLLWTQTHRLDYVGLDTSLPASVQVYCAPPTLAIHSTMGDVTSKLLYDDGTCVQLVNGQQITLWFTLPSQAQSTTRSFILYTDGYYYTITP